MPAGVADGSGRQGHAIDTQRRHPVDRNPGTTVRAEMPGRLDDEDAPMPIHPTEARQHPSTCADEKIPLDEAFATWKKQLVRRQADLSSSQWRKLVAVATQAARRREEWRAPTSSKIALTDLCRGLLMLSCRTPNTCSIITTEANGVVKPVHNRMPVIRDPADYGQWLDSRADSDDLATLLVSFLRGCRRAFPASGFRPATPETRDRSEFRPAREITSP